MTAPRMRAGTTDRQLAVDRLSRHFTEGRLDAGEFDERIGKAYAATYLDELPELSADLPEEVHRGPGARRPGPNGSGQFGPMGRPGAWAGPQFRSHQGPPRFLAAFLLLAVIVSITALTHGFILFPLIWVAVFVLSSGSGARRRRWAESGYGHHPGYDHHRR